MIELNKITLADCMDIMPLIPEMGRDVLAIVDPPYGIGVGTQDNTKRGKLGSHYEKKEWDEKPISKEDIKEIINISNNQIFWGANHYIENININSSCWIVWNKKTVGKTADCELAWTSFKTAVKRFDFLWEGFWQENMKEKEKRIHPTQKPIALYRWLLQNYAKPGQLILDTHSGSGSLACACDLEGFDFIAIEKDPDYHRDSVKRLDELRSQGRLF